MVWARLVVQELDIDYEVSVIAWYRQGYPQKYVPKLPEEPASKVFARSEVELSAARWMKLVPQLVPPRRVYG